MTPLKDFRRARIDTPIELGSDAGRPAPMLPTGECFVEEGPGVVCVHADATGRRELAHVPLADFHAWLARRQVVFLSWG